MTRVTFGFGSNCDSTSGGSNNGVDTAGAVSGDPLIYDAVTGAFEPYSQAGVAARAAYDAQFASSAPVILPPDTTL